MGLHRDGWVKRGQKHGLRVCLNVFESLLFIFVGDMLILMPFVHHHQRSRITFNKPTMSGSVCHKTHTILQEGKLQYPGNHVWQHKRELYIIVHIPWMILTKSPLEDQIVLTLPLPLSWNKQRTPWPFSFICRVM